MTIASTHGLLGMANDRYSTNAEHKLGTVVIANGTSYTYAQATAASIAAAGTVNLTGSYGTSAGTNYTHDVSTTVPQNAYFWAKKATSPF